MPPQPPAGFSDSALPSCCPDVELRNTTMATHGHPYHLRFSPTKTSFSSSSQTASSSSSSSHPTTYLYQRALSDASAPLPLFQEHDPHPRSASQPTTSKDSLGGWTTERAEVESRDDPSSPMPPSHSLDTFSFPRPDPDQRTLLPSPMNLVPSPFDPYSPLHDAPSKFVADQRRLSETPSYISTASTSSSFSSSPYPPAPPTPKRPSRTLTSAIPFIFPSRPAPPPPTETRPPPLLRQTSPSTPFQTQMPKYSPFFPNGEGAEDDAYSYYFTSFSDPTTSSLDHRLSPVIVTTPIVSPSTPFFPEAADQRTKEQRYKDELRAYTQGLLRGVQRAASEPAQAQCDEGMSAWTKAGGVQDVDMNEEEVLVGGSLGRRRGPGKGGATGGAFRDVPIYD